METKKMLIERDSAETYKVNLLCSQLLDYAIADGLENPETFVNNFRQYIGKKIETRFDQYTGGSLLGIRLLDIALNFKSMYDWKIDHCYYVTLSTLKKLKGTSTDKKLTNNAPVLAEIIELLELRQDEKRQKIKPDYIDIASPKYSAILASMDNEQSIRQWKLDSVQDDVITEQLDLLYMRMSETNSKKMAHYLAIGNTDAILCNRSARFFFTNVQRKYGYLFPKLNYMEILHIIKNYS